LEHGGNDRRAEQGLTSSGPGTTADSG
jgi:hypothetical protein